MFEEELHALFFRLGDFGRVCGHVAFLPAVGNRDISAQAHCGAGHVHGDISAADYDDLLADFGLGAGIHFTQEVDPAPDALQILARNPEGRGLLRAYAEEEGIKALLAQLLDGDVLADFHAAAENDAHFLQHIDFRIQNVLFQAEVRNAVTQHAAGLLVPVKNGNAVVVLCQEVGTAEACGACADDGDLLVAVVIELLRNKAGVAVEFPVGDELLDLVDGNGTVDASAGAFVLASAVADPAADCGQRVLFLDEFQRFEVSSLGSQLQVTLNRNVRGAGRLAGRGTLGRNVLTV